MKKYVVFYLECVGSIDDSRHVPFKEVTRLFDDKQSAVDFLYDVTRNLGYDTFYGELKEVYVNE